MASFMANLFPGGKPDKTDARPSTPTRNSFVTPVSTPQGSPSKKTVPPGANELPVALQGMKINPPSAFDTPVKLSRPQSVVAPLSPGKSNLQAAEENSPTVDDSIIRKGIPRTGSPLRNQGQENTHPTLPRDPFTEPTYQPSHAAVSRQELYQPRDRPPPTVRRFNTTRGLTAEERELLQKPGRKTLGQCHTTLKNIHHRRRPTRRRITRCGQSTPGRERANLRKRRVRLRHADFQILTQVGQGGYGQVFLAQKKDTKEVCALKVMSKKLLFKLDEVRHVLTERDILTTAKSDWLVRLLYSFQDDKNIYLAMEYVPGGDFRTLLNNTGVLSNRHARFYIAEMFCAVDALHQLGYIHRDLKPENFLVDSTGHVKLTDFGLAAGFLAPAKIESMRIRLEKASETSVPFGKPMDQRTVAERREGYRTMREKD
ncbi:hypothetical protein CHGG_06482 [Chaetomium globosum CBS 148.51]|uniref:non-specific serine/threonine protein kinase n=1 Tax=Chaetomium globosum (strain ATCC 6205 / CBS 148.51 / DSM 1962 / NBRC 6347 / NRRL 1970) TaxID=306901 RepID=Q2H4D3_CHAGB|nr:uncharacterized protein CHGG_06482 [Chaetomium globosum CBS 148.51]EAQ89863.1 hypothetical protein CHGG_06482 [Chaetomium globosum CBS 148.51]